MRVAGQRRERRDAVEVPFELADVRAHALGDEERDFVRQVDLLLFRFLAKDRDLRLEVGRLDVGDQSPLEARAEPLFERRDLFRRRVGGEDDLLLRFVERVEGVEELFLRPFLAGEELDVVEQQRVDGAIAIAELLHPVVADRGDQLGDERVGRHVDDLHARVRVADLLADRLDQMRLAEAGAAVDEERVERAAGILGDRLRRRAGELVRFADDERLEPVPRIEDRERELVARRRRPASGTSSTAVSGVDDEVDLDALGRDLVEDGADLLRRSARGSRRRSAGRGR